MENTIMQDCFAFKGDADLQSSSAKFTGCKILEKMLCLERKCPFYKTQEEYKKDLNVQNFVVQILDLADFKVKNNF